MESRAKVFGHPIHPILIVFPLGLLATALGLDVAYALTHRAGLAVASYWNIGIGVVAGLLAAVFGAIDWFAIPPGTRARTVGLWHGLGNAVVLGLFAVAWVSRADSPLHEPTRLAIVVELMGGGLALVTGWLGGEMVDRLGVGVDDGAHLDAPSSLTRENPRAAGCGREPDPARQRGSGSLSTERRNARIACASSGWR
jgi:uncharacterized membrane protein